SRPSLNLLLPPSVLIIGEPHRELVPFHVRFYVGESEHSAVLRFEWDQVTRWRSDRDLRVLAVHADGSRTEVGRGYDKVSDGVGPLVIDSDHKYVKWARMVRQMMEDEPGADMLTRVPPRVEPLTQQI